MRRTSLSDRAPAERATQPAGPAGNQPSPCSPAGSAVVALGRVALAGVVGLAALLAGAGAAFADPTGASGGAAPGLSLFSGLTGWISQYGWAGAPLAISIGGLLMTVEHHQQRTGNAVRAKGYIFAAGAGLMVISLAGAGTDALRALVGH